MRTLPEKREEKVRKLAQCTEGDMKGKGESERGMCLSGGAGKQANKQVSSVLCVL